MYLFISLNLLFLFTFLDNILLIISFSINLMIISYGIYYSTKNKWLNIDVVIWNFKYLFFFFAPIIQINSGIFPNNLFINTNKILMVNLFLAIWYVLYIVIRKKRYLDPVNQFNFDNHKFTLNFYMCSSILIAGFILANYKLDFTLGYVGWSSLIENKSSFLIVIILTSGIMYGNFIFQFNQYLQQKTMRNSMTFILSIILLLFVVNPFNMSRYYLGFICITTIFLFFRRKIRSILFNAILFLGIFTIFPLINFFRFGFTAINFSEMKQEMFQQFNELHFDAYANMIATLDYVHQAGVSFGYQLLGVFFFFVPRGIWESKPLQTGELIGNYLIANGKLNYNNLANALPSEMYINFGIFGILAAPILLGLLINKLEKNAKTMFLNYAIISGFIFFIYRGALMSGFAYCVGTIIIIYCASTFINYVSKGIPNGSKR